MFGNKKIEKKIENLNDKIRFLAQAIDKIEAREKYTYDNMMMPTGFCVDRIPFPDVFKEVMKKLGIELSARSITFNAEKEKDETSASR